MLFDDKFLSRLAKLEGVGKEKLVKGLKSGRIAIPYNKVHSPIHPMAVGEGLRTKVNANIGTSKEFNDINAELEKVDVCIKYKADALMDLSVGGNLDEVERRS